MKKLRMQQLHKPGPSHLQRFVLDEDRHIVALYYSISALVESTVITSKWVSLQTRTATEAMLIQIHHDHHRLCHLLRQTNRRIKKSESTR